MIANIAVDATSKTPVCTLKTWTHSWLLASE